MVEYQKGTRIGGFKKDLYREEAQARHLRALMKVIRKTNQSGAKVVLRSGKQDDSRLIVFETRNTMIVHGIRLERQDEAAGMLYAMFNLAESKTELLFVEPLSSTGYRIANHMERPK